MVNHICFCADGNYLNYVPAVIESVCRADSAAEIQFHVISDEPETDQFRKLMEKISMAPAVQWHAIDAAEFAGSKETLRFTKAMYYRLLIPELISAERVLYLDCDVLVRDTLMPLFSLDFGTAYLAAVDNPFFNRFSELGLTADMGYFNSGVLLINSELWRRDNLKQKVMEVVASAPELLHMPDQDAINRVVAGNWLRLPIRYNMQMSFFLRPAALSTQFPELPDALRNPCIVHFSTPNKQWHASCFSRYADEYRRLNASVVIPRKHWLIDISFRFWKRLQIRWLQSNPYI
ncbi:MAG: hypothetical protein CML06_17365 [Pseudomonadales bacterium]|nr:hypothetical protein [Pseudomonadales bacterium]